MTLDASDRLSFAFRMQELRDLAALLDDAGEPARSYTGILRDTLLLLETRITLAADALPQET